MYLTRKFMLSTGTKQEDLPDFLQVQVVLNEMHEMDLKNLREWIFKKSFASVREKSKLAEKPLEEKTIPEIKDNQQSLGVFSDAVISKE